MKQCSRPPGRPLRYQSRCIAGDEREGGVRTHINFGNGIEWLQSYVEGLHGKDLAAGLVLPSEISAVRGGPDEAVLQKLLLLHEVCGLPSGPLSDLPAAVLLEAMINDKKVTDGKIHHILLGKLLEKLITKCVTEQEIVALISAH